MVKEKSINMNEADTSEESLVLDVWVKEAERRLADLRAGRSVEIPACEVFLELRQTLEKGK